MEIEEDIAKLCLLMYRCPLAPQNTYILQLSTQLQASQNEYCFCLSDNDLLMRTSYNGYMVEQEHKFMVTLITFVKYS